MISEGVCKIICMIVTCQYWTEATLPIQDESETESRLIEEVPHYFQTCLDSPMSSSSNPSKKVKKRKREYNTKDIGLGGQSGSNLHELVVAIIKEAGLEKSSNVLIQEALQQMVCLIIFTTVRFLLMQYLIGSKWNWWGWWGRNRCRESWCRRMGWLFPHYFKEEIV